MSLHPSNTSDAALPSGLPDSTFVNPAVGMPDTNAATPADSRGTGSVDFDDPVIVAQFSHVEETHKAIYKCIEEMCAKRLRFFQEFRLRAEDSSLWLSRLMALVLKAQRGRRLMALRQLHIAAMAARDFQTSIDLDDSLDIITRSMPDLRRQVSEILELLEIDEPRMSDNERDKLREQLYVLETGLSSCEIMEKSIATTYEDIRPRFELLCLPWTDLQPMLDASAPLGFEREAVRQRLADIVTAVQDIMHECKEIEECSAVNAFLVITTWSRNLDAVTMEDRVDMLGDYDTLHADVRSLLTQQNIVLNAFCMEIEAIRSAQPLVRTPLDDFEVSDLSATLLTCHSLGENIRSICELRNKITNGLNTMSDYLHGWRSSA
ncbi:uncharacterized protein TRAVEDRAFT_23392 [Trametes versicolor FP-101664 SS1]|uniref:uncharacterized protein n=1 Tax=Trametes versicolor (strain FP-101664) TaxID=717944 RepID=UPI0004622821|nr:uncharacterized protein TRAVEDRAFT_23392 [Trametes versicolor FP-101664 SS1]EIW54250.1 hypothetical protein TRAVEDRAFT_23392 [Trametes versicolor FP-101664 SS1]